MTTMNDGRRWRPRASIALLATLVALGGLASHGADAAQRHKAPAQKVAARAGAMPYGTQARPAAPSTAAAPSADDGLSYSDEYERAELVDRMLTECRGVPYNAYELARTSGESLWLPAPIQLMVLRVRHPFCAELLRTYAPKTAV